MKLLDKIKNAIFEEEEFDEEFINDTPVKEEKKKEPIKEEEIVKKIDIEKTIPKKIEIPTEESLEKKQPMKREMRRTPVIFDENDFVVEEPKRERKPRIEPKKEEVKKPLYGGYRDDTPKEKFKPSPIISPVYGFVGVSPVLEQARSDDSKAEQHIFIQDKKETVSLDSVRKKAFGVKEEALEDDDLGLLYEMKKEETPAISKITLGDAEEYFEDLGLEYNVDYKDDAKEKEVKKEVKPAKEKTTRSTKNKELSDKVENQIKIQKELESTKELEITKEQIKPKSAKEIKKVKKIADADLGMKEEPKEEADEKNLYDLIDMMYDSK